MIIPTILEKNLEEIKRKISLVDGLCEFIQIDIADGKFIGESTFANIGMLAGIEPLSKLEIHLMVENPDIYVEESYPSIFKISAHIEAKGIENFIRKAVEKKYIVGVSIKAETKFDDFGQLPGGIDFVQFMTGTIGTQGSDIKREVFPKIAAFKQKYPNMRVQIDGGVREENIKDILKLGVDDVVIGSQIINSENPSQMLKRFEELAAL